MPLQRRAFLALSLTAALAACAEPRWADDEAAQAALREALLASIDGDVAR